MNQILSGCLANIAFTCSSAYFLRATNLDQKIFNFVAPRIREAGALSALFCVSNLVLKVIVIGVGWGSIALTNWDNKTKEPLRKMVVTISMIFIPLLAAFLSMEVLRRNHYAIPYQFAAVCLILPYIKGFKKIILE